MPLSILFINAIDPAQPIQTVFPPLGIGYLVASLRREFGAEAIRARVVDRDVEAELASFAPDLVAISAVSHNYRRAEAYAALAKRSGLPVICGGVHITMAPATLSRDMDAGALGEGERTVCDLVALLMEKGALPAADLQNIPGLVTWSGGKPSLTAPRPPVERLDLLPFPARDLLDIKPYTYLFTSRGCPYRCTFCASTRFWDSVRFFSAEYVVEEIALLARDYGVTHINFQDDLFMLSAERIARIIELLREQGLLGRIEFSGAIRANLANDKILALLKEMGVRMLNLGLESGCDETLAYLKAGSVTVQQNRDAVRLIKKYGILAGGSFIIGAPQESREDLEKTVAHIKDLDLDGISFYVLTPFPGTPVWDYAKSRGLVSDQMDWERLDVDFGSHPDNAIVVSEKLSRQEILGYYREIEAYVRRRRLLKQLSAGLRAPWKIPGFVWEKCRQWGWHAAS